MINGQRLAVVLPAHNAPAVRGENREAAEAVALQDKRGGRPEHAEAV